MTIKHFGNIRAYRFVDCWPNGRLFSHGAMEIEFVFKPKSRESAENDVESFMLSMDYERGVHYNIPGWNYRGSYYYPYIVEPFRITFVDDQMFVMAKLCWGK